MKVTNNLITIDFTVSELQLIENSLNFMVDHLDEHIEEFNDALECDDKGINKEMVTRCLNDTIESYNTHVQLMKAIGEVVGTTYDKGAYEFITPVEED
jgi:hypothetical protein